MDLIDSKYKEERLRKFINQLKKSQQIIPFLYLEDIFKYGVRDFYHFANTNINLQIIEQKLPTYRLLDEFVRDLASVFNTVSLYAFLDDPIQQTCKAYLQKINKFAQQFRKDVQLQKQTKTKLFQNRRPKQSRQAKQLRQSKQSKDQKQLKYYNQQQFLKLKTTKIFSQIQQKLDILFALRKQQTNLKLFREMSQQSHFCTNQSDIYTIEINPSHSFWSRNLPNTYRN